MRQQKGQRTFCVHDLFRQIVTLGVQLSQFKAQCLNYGGIGAPLFCHSQTGYRSYPIPSYSKPSLCSEFVTSVTYLIYFPSRL
jgi:hypothetical protein